MSCSYLPALFLGVLLQILTAQLCVCDSSYTTGTTTTPSKYLRKPPTPFHYKPPHQQQKSLLLSDHQQAPSHYNSPAPAPSPGPLRMPSPAHHGQSHKPPAPAPSPGPARMPSSAHHRQSHKPPTPPGLARRPSSAKLLLWSPKPKCSKWPNRSCLCSTTEQNGGGRC